MPVKTKTLILIVVFKNAGKNNRVPSVLIEDNRKIKKKNTKPSPPSIKTLRDSFAFVEYSHYELSYILFGKPTDAVIMHLGIKCA